MDASNPPNIKRVTPEELRKRFNDGGYWEKVQNGEWTAQVLEGTTSLLLKSETAEIQSVMLSYRDASNNEMARVHQFVRPDGSIAASGKPDPKRVFDEKEDTWYRLKKKGRL